MAVKKSGKDSSGLPDSFGAGTNNDVMRESFYRDELPNQSRSQLANRFKAIADSPMMRTRRAVAVLTAIVTIFVTLGISSFFATNTIDTTTLAARISGGVALSEGELKDVVAKLGETVYWAGPVRGAKYTINAQNVGAIYVRYLPDGNGISDTTPKFRVIATYKEANGYDATLAAGNQPNGVSFAKADGSTVVYYNKNTPTNVYLAYKGKPSQIEIFDPSAEVALALANDNKKIIEIN